ncbi:MAG: hypothetical protein R3E01_36460 [Pirellulaceae bacterium]|nr:hypothetical protein [Planctomycetales bacterium]
MSRLTVTEKEHWKERIERRVNRAIATLEAQDLSLMPGITAEADRLAHDALGTAEFHDKIEALNAQLITLKAEQERLERTMYARALGELALRTLHDYRLRDDFRVKHRRVKEPIEERLLAQSPIGREILKLRAEKETLLDTVWLATSNTQIRELWAKVSAVLGDEATPLQQQILDNDTTCVSYALFSSTWTLSA